MKTSKNAKNTKAVKHLVTIDITEIYDRIKSLAEEEERTVDGQCKYLIKKSLNAPNVISLTPIKWEKNVWPNDSYGWHASNGPSYNLCSGNNENELINSVQSGRRCGGDGSVTDVEYNASTGSFEPDSKNFH